MSTVRKLFNRFSRRKKSTSKSKRNQRSSIAVIPENPGSYPADSCSLAESTVSNATIAGYPSKSEDLEGDYCQPIDLKQYREYYHRSLGCEVPESDYLQNYCRKNSGFDEVFDDALSYPNTNSNSQSIAPSDNLIDDKSSQVTTSVDEHSEADGIDQSNSLGEKKRRSRPHLPSQDSRSADDYDDPWQSITGQTLKLTDKVRYSTSSAVGKYPDEPNRSRQRPHSVTGKTLYSPTNAKEFANAAAISTTTVKASHSKDSFDANRSRTFHSITLPSQDLRAVDEYEDPWKSISVEQLVEKGSISTSIIDQQSQHNNSEITNDVVTEDKPMVPPRLPEDILQCVEMAVNDQDHLYASPDDEIIISAQYPADTSWYHGALVRNQAESVLQSLDAGSFLVRDSESGKKKKAYSLSIRTQNSGIIHIKIDLVPEGYVIGKNGKVFSSLNGMIEYYQGNPLKIKGDEQQPLLYPVHKIV